MSISKDKTPNCKVVLLGESGVGKTCIIARYINGTYDEKSESTNGASYASKTISYDNINKSLQFDIWDTAGQERYRALTKFFYKDAAIAILVYDVTRKDSFEELQNYWAKQIKESSPENIILVIAANKSDLIEYETVDEGEARNFAKEISAIFISTSAKNSEGINNLFEEIAKKYTGSSNITIKEEEGDDQVEEQKNTVKIENTGNNKQPKKKGFC